MEEIPWFEYDQDDLSAGQREFADVLAKRAAFWSVDPLSTVLLRPFLAPYGQLLAYLNIDDPEHNQIVLTIGAHFDGAAVRADELHNQLFTLPERPTEFTFAAAGSPTEAASRTADWFEAILARPLVRCEWLHAGKMYAVRYQYADNGRGLCRGFHDAFAPAGLRERLIARGVVQGRGWINYAGLGAPDRIVHVRGDRTASGRMHSASVRWSNGRASAGDGPRERPPFTTLEPGAGATRAAQPANAVMFSCRAALRWTPRRTRERTSRFRMVDGNVL